MTEYTNLDTPEAVRAALERGVVERRTIAGWRPVAYFVSDESLAADLAAGALFRAPLPAVTDRAPDGRDWSEWDYPDFLRLQAEHVESVELAAMFRGAAGRMESLARENRQLLSVCEAAGIADIKPACRSAGHDMDATPAAAVPAAGDWVRVPRTVAEAVDSVLASRFPRCRDCADESGVCPQTGLPCGLSLAKGFAAIPAPPEKSSKVVLRPLEWNDPKGEVTRWNGWSDKRFGFHIGIDDDDRATTAGFRRTDGPYVATWGEGDPEYFATLDEAKAWCHDELTRWISSVVDVVPAETREAVAEQVERLAAMLCDDFKGPIEARYDDRCQAGKDRWREKARRILRSFATPPATLIAELQALADRWMKPGISCEPDDDYPTASRTCNECGKQLRALIAGAQK